MISIIICSRASEISVELRQNIGETIGSDYELVVIDNSENRYSIFSAYNEGIRRAKGDVFCFMHEDILFHTKGWGVRVEHTLVNEEIGLVGVIGSQYKSAQCIPWWADFACVGQLIQGSIQDKEYKIEKCSHWERRIGDSDEVAMLDGLWFCARRDLFSTISFDEITYDGFHMYDADICMQVHSIGLQVCVLYEVWIEHKSPGNPNDAFVTQLNLWFEKWKDSLPIYKGRVGENEVLIPEDICSKWSAQREDYRKKYNAVLQSKAYRLGKLFLHPSIKNLNNLLK